VSLGVNYPLGMALAQKPWGKAKRKALLALGIAGNLAALCYYKYTGLFFKTLNMAGGHYDIPDIVLPLGISFFTFQKIAWLVDSYRRETDKPGFLHYSLFITFFPQLIAGPIVHHREVIPQFLRAPALQERRQMLATGLTVFIIGLFKKVVIADHMGDVAAPVFASAALLNALTVTESWLGVIAYTLQIYFDFSGYSDMAVGLGGMFGIRLPLNFFSPYKSASIIEFWRRWHITLSRFLRDYLYIPLGGNKKGIARRYLNLMVTMLLGGLWHGANWTFVFWGALHGLYLCINHAWSRTKISLPKPLAVAVTFFAVAVAWVFFRADSFSTATHMLSCMAGKFGFAPQNKKNLLDIEWKWLVFCGALAVAFLAPSAHEFVKKALALDSTGVAKDKTGKIPAWEPSGSWAAVMALMAAASLLLLTRVNAFIYFQF